MQQQAWPTEISSLLEAWETSVFSSQSIDTDRQSDVFSRMYRLSGLPAPRIVHSVSPSAFLENLNQHKRAAGPIALQPFNHVAEDVFDTMAELIPESVDDLAAFLSDTMSGTTNGLHHSFEDDIVQTNADFDITSHYRVDHVMWSGFMSNYNAMAPQLMLSHLGIVRTKTADLLADFARECYNAICYKNTVFTMERPAAYEPAPAKDDDTERNLRFRIRYQDGSFYNAFTSRKASNHGFQFISQKRVRRAEHIISALKSRVASTASGRAPPADRVLSAARPEPRVSALRVTPPGALSPTPME